MTRALLWITLGVVVFGHLTLVFLNIMAFFVLPFVTPWYEAAPLMSFLGLLITTNAAPCPLTRVENCIRRALGLREVKLFVGHYLVWPVRKFFRRLAR